MKLNINIPSVRENVVAMNINLNCSIPLDAEKISTAQRVLMPRPKFQFLEQPQTFSTKKQKYENEGTPRHHVPPTHKPPANRHQSRKSSQLAPVPFKGGRTISLSSPPYNKNSSKPYFEQMFVQESCLGAGSFGEVFKVQSKDDGKTYAVKKAMSQYKGVEDRRCRLQEVKIQAKLQDHPNCVKIIHAWEENDLLYIQTELCQTDLSSLAHKNHNIPERLIGGYLVDLLKALEHLHNCDFLHMDIKLENVFVTEDGVCKLGDFGLAVDLNDKNLDPQMGDPMYIAQECITQNHFSKAADVFSLGISMFELATDLALPTSGPLWCKLRNDELDDTYYNSRETPVSPELRKILNRMMERNPDERPTVQQLLEDPYIKSLVAQRNRELTFKSVTPTKDVAEENRSSTSNQKDLSPVRDHRIQYDIHQGDTSSSDDKVFKEDFNFRNKNVGTTTGGFQNSFLHSPTTRAMPARKKTEFHLHNNSEGVPTGNCQVSQFLCAPTTQVMHARKKTEFNPHNSAGMTTGGFQGSPFLCAPTTQVMHGRKKTEFNLNNKSAGVSAGGFHVSPFLCAPTTQVMHASKKNSIQSPQQLWRQLNSRH